MVMGVWNRAVPGGGPPKLSQPKGVLCCGTLKETDLDRESWPWKNLGVRLDQEGLDPPGTVKAQSPEASCRVVSCPREPDLVWTWKEAQGKHPSTRRVWDWGASG